ncbi:MAG: hypothetical protein GY697_09975 [Desulfobacterales bacterium]|nr:hypothetical protein [Desulfobacterales bacterium]
MEGDATLVMDTVKINVLQGIIQGVVESDFQKLSEKISPILKNIWWDKDCLFINNTDREQFFGDYHQLEEIFDQIAAVVTSGQYGKLGFIGLMGKREIVATVYFGNKKWELKEFSRPSAPEWYKSEEWHKMEKWREEDLEWDELFKRLDG